LRLALVQALSREGEKLPHLLDDPFGNYDDVRLQRTLKLLAQIAKNQQVLLFTCHDSVVKAAKKAGAAVLEL